MVSSGGPCSSTSRPHLSFGRMHPTSMPLYCGKWRNSSERLERIITRECSKSSTFSVIQKQGGELKRYAQILINQHNRGREITDYVLAITNSSRISTAHAEPLAKVLEGFVLMYQNHAAREDTIVFPAWKKNFSNKQLDEISDQFEEIEHKMFGKDGFEDAEQKISSVESSLGLSDLAQFTPLLPPKP